MANTVTLRLETVEGTGLRFQAQVRAGLSLTLDSGPNVAHPNPVDTMLAALGGCGAMDVISILRKKRQTVTGYEVVITGQRRDTHPRAFTHVETLHRVRGRHLNPNALEDAIRLTDTKYCSVRASIDPMVPMLTRYEIVPDGPDAGAPASGVVSERAAVTTPERHGLSELILRVADVDRSVTFYRDVVGLTLERRDSETWAWMWTGREGRLPRLGLTSRPLSFGAAHTGGPAHFALAVAREDIPAERARLQSLGVEVEGPVTFEAWSADSIYFSDPDTNRVELCGFEHLNRRRVPAAAPTEAPQA